MLTLRTLAPRLKLPTGIPLWLLEGGIALILSAYLAYQCYQPLTRGLNRIFDAQAVGSVAILFLIAILLPLLWSLLTMLVVLMAGLLAPAVRTTLDVLVLTLLITALAVPSLRDVLDTSQPPPSGVSSASFLQPQETGRLNAAPSPLKLERIPLGVEVLNEGTQPLDVTVLFVKLNERSRSYCAGKPLSSPRSLERKRLAAGESMIFMSGNCQDGHVALTVWDSAGKRLYQTSAIQPSDRPQELLIQ